MGQKEIIEKIDLLTAKYRDSIIQPDGSHSIKTEFDKYLILNNFAELELIQDLNIIRELPRFLIRTSMFPRGCCYQNKDHAFFLVWTSKTLQKLIRSPLYEDKNDRHYIDLLINLLFCLRRPSPTTFL